jgi:hypothetical protein
MMFLQTCSVSEHFTLALGGVSDLYCYFDLMLRIRTKNIELINKACLRSN